MRPLLIPLLFALLVIPGSVRAQSSVRDQRLQQLLKRFPAADSNHDGRLTLEEARQFNRQRRDQNPTDGDGRIEPTEADVSYGDHKLQTFDLWLAPTEKADGPTPLCIYIHGGGFRGGDKRGVRSEIIQRFLDAGISFVSLNYRLTDGGKYPYPTAMHDAARGLQFIRMKAADWNLDPDRIACYGGSAGAGISLWLAFHEDLAQPNGEARLERQSTRIVAAGTMGGQSTYDLRIYRKWFGVPDLPPHDALADFYGMKPGETVATPRIAALAEDASPITHLTRDDPPVYMVYNQPNTKVIRETPQGVWVHHPLLGIKLKEAMETLGLECTVTGPDLKDQRYQDLFDFLIQKLKSNPNSKSGSDAK